METIVVLATIPAIVALVQFSKAFGVSGKWLTAEAVIFGVLFKVLDYIFLEAWGAVTPPGIYVALVTGLILGLSAAGLYDVAKTVGVPTKVEVNLAGAYGGESAPPVVTTDSTTTIVVKEG